MTVVERAADVIDRHRGNIIKAREGLQVAQELADEGLLLTDADRSALDAADAFMRADEQFIEDADQEDTWYAAAHALAAAVRARRAAALGGAR